MAFRRAGVVVAMALVTALGGCGDDEAPRDVLEFCGDVPAPAGSSGQDRFVVLLEPGSDLADDVDARTELYAEVSAGQCFSLSEVPPAMTDAVVVRSDRLLGPTEQARLRRALEADPGVRLAEPDALQTPDGSSDRSSDGSSDRQGTR